MSKQDEVHVIGEADHEFHCAAAALFDALKFARSMKSDGQTIEAYGKAVTIARRLIAADDVLHALDPNGVHGARYEDENDRAQALALAAPRAA